MATDEEKDEMLLIWIFFDDCAKVSLHLIHIGCGDVVVIKVLVDDEHIINTIEVGSYEFS